MTIAIIGANGQLGKELTNMLDKEGTSYIGVDRDELDITDQSAVIKFMKENNPHVVYHCAAYTAVDSAEDECKEINWKVNVEGTSNVAYGCELVGATLVYISTDYVFDGLSEKEYDVDDEVNPQNEYGKAKLAGEIAVKNGVSKYYIIRTSWVFGEHGNNFVYTMRRLADTHPRLTVVNDQFGRPTWTKTLAEFMVFVIENQVNYGIYHLSNKESGSWYDFAKEILKSKKIAIDPVDSSKFPQKAKRPQYSVMDLSKAEATGFHIPTWKEALHQFQESIKL